MLPAKPVKQLFISGALTRIGSRQQIYHNCHQKPPSSLSNCIDIVEDRMELYVKAGPNGEIGDCPFAHFIRCILNAKQLDYKVIPCNQSTKPDWLINDDKLGGKMPCLKDGDTKVVESMEIAKYLEAKCPEPRLPAKHMDLVDPIFPAFAKFMKNADYCPDREKAFLQALKTLDSHLDGGAFVGGSGNVSLADYSLAPKLQHIQVTVAEFTPETKEKLVQACPNLSGYMERIGEDDAFTSAKPKDDLIIWGWGQARK